MQLRLGSVQKPHSLERVCCKIYQMFFLEDQPALSRISYIRTHADLAFDVAAALVL